MLHAGPEDIFVIFNKIIYLNMLVWGWKISAYQPLLSVPDP